MKFIKILFLVCLIQASSSAERFHENGFVQPHLLAETIEKNRKSFLGHKFMNGETLINLIPIDNIDRAVQIEQNDSGAIRTLYTLNGWNITFKQYDSCIAPCMESAEKNLRLNRLDSQGFAKENSDGSIKLGTIDMRKLTPISGSFFSTVDLLSFPQELHIQNQEQQRQRRPEDLRDKEFSKRKPLIPHIPTQEELQAIAGSKKASRQDQLLRLSVEFNGLNLELLKDEESLEKIKSLRFGVPFLQNKIDDEILFNSSFNNMKKSVFELQQSISQELRTIHSRSISSSDFASSFDTKTLTKETKVEADRLILKEAEKEESRLKRSNANPSGKEEVLIEQENPELKKVPVLPYVFQNPLTHQIIQDLKATSNEDSSYSGIKISRGRLKNFVEFLKHEEHTERGKAGETIREDLLRYYYAPDQGDGSHAKVKLGYGAKPIILSQQGTWLTTPQLKDLKAALEQKGLL